MTENTPLEALREHADYHYGGSDPELFTFIEGVEQQLEQALHTMETVKSLLQGAPVFLLHGTYVISESYRDQAVHLLDAVPTEPVKHVVELEGMLAAAQHKLTKDTDALFLKNKNSERERDQALAVIDRIRARAERLAKSKQVEDREIAEDLRGILSNIPTKKPYKRPTERYAEWCDIQQLAGRPTMPYWKWFEKSYDINPDDETFTYVGDKLP